MGSIKLFKEDCNNMSNLKLTIYNAGIVAKDGTISYNQSGAEATFSVGMPIYSAKTGACIGRLSIGNYDCLDTVVRDAFGSPVPATKWFIAGYSGERQGIKTYWQMLKEAQKKGSER